MSSNQCLGGVNRSFKCRSVVQLLNSESRKDCVLKAMDSHPRRQERSRGDHRPRYYRGNRRGNFINRQQRENQERNLLMNLDDSIVDVVVSENASARNTGDFAATSETNFSQNFDRSTEPPRFSKNKYNSGDFDTTGETNSSKNYNSSSTEPPRFAKNKHFNRNQRENQNNNVHRTDRNYESSQLNVNAPSFTPTDNHLNYEQNASQRGKIIGGRYIRKHSNQSEEHSRSNNHENAASYEHNSNFSSHSNSYRNKNPSNHRYQNKDFSESDARRPFTRKFERNNDNPSRSYVSRQRPNENAFEPSDAYHFTSLNINNEGSSKSTKKFSPNLSPVKNPQGTNATQRELLIQQLDKGDCECLVKWARSPTACVPDEGWRCPACQSITAQVPFNYYCFCGTHKNPDVNYHLTPHSCGEICRRVRPECSHSCKELCHPGPCPPCSVVVQKYCGCGKTSKALPCKHDIEETCDSMCEKTLNCGVHKCMNKCHAGLCSPCEKQVHQDCYCQKSERDVICDTDTYNILNYTCGKTCEKPLDCGNHTCGAVCHPSDCKPCNRSIKVVKYCPCGKTSIQTLIDAGKATERKSCLDPVPLCNKKCEKMFSCGPKDELHECKSQCHEGDCPSCPLTTILKVSCGNHQCQNICHAGNCNPCEHVSFDELRCHCGESVMYPPIPCGTKPPECSNPCIRNHSCDHEVKHPCHSDETCPPCTSFTVKWCYGRHKQCNAVMCFVDGISCGMSCLKDLPCGKHKCKLTCHAGSCLKENAKCTQLCNIPRPTCGHPCGNHCHEGECPDTPCKSQVTLICPCGRRSETTTCYDSINSYRLMSVSVLATKMQEIKEGQSVNLNDVLGKKLQCNEECAVIERNKRLALALQIQNPDLSTSPGPPNYSDFLKAEAKKNPLFVTDVYDKITELVQLAKESKQKCRSYSFPAMNRDHRRVVHELAEFFGCETQSYDEEPKKSVVVTAHKTKCWLPFVSIMTVVQRDMGFRKGPTPVIVPRESKTSSANSAANNQKKKIDYFDYNE
ncbi:protein shuttle craft [Caerostris extrusa]|uniref:Protein shuttle craft n=1 Tax=Caerostris extrusa TaxID=172846 RepID=A0AAV4RL38_CAEEX|nr:protein shuttle craft [Caerostris extrusa]